MSFGEEPRDTPSGHDHASTFGNESLSVERIAETSELDNAALRMDGTYTSQSSTHGA
jgi:hypothetical protein